MKSAKLCALFLVSIVNIAYELYVMRVFSIGGWESFGSLVISAALLGTGISGIILSFLSEWVERNADAILTVLAVLLPPLLPLAVLAAGTVPFNPVFLASDAKQWLYIGAYYLIYGTPFFVMAMFTGVCFIMPQNEIQKVYFANMLGAGAGSFVIILFMFLLPPRFLLLPVIFLSVVAAAFACLTQNGGTRGLEFSVAHILLMLVSASGAIFITFSGGDIRVSDYKAVSYVRKYPDSRLVHHSWSPGGEYHVYYSKYFHFAPGLSDAAAVNIDAMSSQPYWGLFIDGSGPVGVMGYMRENEKRYIDYLPMAAPYLLLDKPDTLLINLSGGINASTARHKGAKKIDIVEPSRDMARLLKYDPNITRFTGGLLAESNIKIYGGDGRAWCLSHRNSYDLIEISLVDSIGLSDSGGYAVREDFKYTTEAFNAYLDGLKDDGILSVTVWDKLNPPRNVPKLLNTVITAMKEERIAEAGRCLYSFGLLMSTTTILVKKTPFTDSELRKLNIFVNTRSFERFYPPPAGQDGGDGRLDRIIAAYRRNFEDNGAGADDYSNADMYRAVTPVFFSNDSSRIKSIEDEYVFDIRAIRDSRPYYSGYIKPRLLPLYLKSIRSVSEEWGYLLLIGMLLQACIAALAVILLPLIFAGKRLYRGASPVSARRKIGVILYYAGLGAGYMLIEIFLIQRLGFFLSNPTYSTGIVISAMLIFSGLGNLFGGLLKKYRRVAVPLSCMLASAAFAFYIFGMDAFLALFDSARLFWRVIAAVILIAPPAFFMGVPFPTGLGALRENNPALLPWAWGMNGGLSVAGSALARVISVSQGFPALLSAAIAVYVMAGLLFGSHEPPKAGNRPGGDV
jgi:hypothetical protein